MREHCRRRLCQYPPLPHARRCVHPSFAVYTGITHLAQHPPIPLRIPHQRRHHRNLRLHHQPSESLHLLFPKTLPCPSKKTPFLAHQHHGLVATSTLHLPQNYPYFRYLLFYPLLPFALTPPDHHHTLAPALHPDMLSPATPSTRLSSFTIPIKSRVRCCFISRSPSCDFLASFAANCSAHPSTCPL